MAAKIHLEASETIQSGVLTKDRSIPNVLNSGCHLFRSMEARIDVGIAGLISDLAFQGCTRSFRPTVRSAAETTLARQVCGAARVDTKAELTF
jgi:hypothetical protein